MSKSSQVLFVVGPQAFDDFDLVDRTLDLLHSREPIRRLYVGSSVGIGRVAKTWALKRSIQVSQYPLKDSAGFERLLQTTFDAKAVSFSNGSGPKHSTEIVVEKNPDRVGKLFRSVRVGQAVWVQAV
jgi:hypothetical protein